MDQRLDSSLQRTIIYHRRWYNVRRSTAIAAQCAIAGWFHRVLKITNAYHTPLMRPCKDEALRTFSSTLSGVGSAQLPYFSTVTAAWKESDFDAQYTWDGIEGAVHFHEAVTACLERFGDDTVFMEMSAHPVLSSYLLECGAEEHHRHTAQAAARARERVPTVRVPANQRASLPTCALCCPATAALPILPALLLPVRPLPQGGRQPHVPPHRAQPPASRLSSAWPPSSLHGKLKSACPLSPGPADHVVQGAVVFPAAGYLEMCMEVLGMQLRVRRGDRPCE